MIPKEKAEELVNKYLLKTPVGFHIDDAKQCALIAVNEIIDALELYDTLTELYLKQEFGLDYFSSELQNMDNDFRYWDKVKQEIEKL
jgi:hypothetical protein